MIADQVRVTSTESWFVVTPGKIQLQGTAITITHTPEMVSPYETMWNGNQIFGGLHSSLPAAKKFVEELIARLIEMGQEP